MALALRITLLVVSVLTLAFVSKRVRSSKVRLEDSISWFCFAVLLLLASLFPQIFYVLSDLVGPMAPVNFVFLFFIFILLIQSFSLTMRVSQADTKIKELSQQLAIEKYERHTNDEKSRD